jgi:hypothetical protein
VRDAIERYQVLDEHAAVQGEESQEGEPPAG